MGWNDSTKILTGAGFNKINANGLGDLQRALRRGVKSHILLVGDLSEDSQGNISDANAINPFAIHKPVCRGGIVAPTNAQKAAVNYGIVVPELTLQQLFTAGADYAWKYNKPDGSTYPLRATDFISKDNPSTRGYYADAPRNVLCCYRDADIDVNVVNEHTDVDSIVFCAFSKNGDATTNAIFDKQPSATSGISNTSYGHSAAQLQCAVAIEDLYTDSSSALYGTGHRLGVALKKSNGGYSFIACPEDLVNNTALLDLDRFKINSDDIRVLDPGTYTAVGCLRIYDSQSDSYRYAPLHPKDWNNAAGAKNSFQINVGGTENYNVTTVGVGGTPTDTPAGSCTSDYQAYLTIRVKNNSAQIHITSSLTFSNWTNHVHIVGSYVDTNNRTHSLDFYLDPQIYMVVGGSGSGFTINPGETVDLMFALTGVWGNETEPEYIVSGQVVVTPDLQYDGESFSGLYQTCVINFGH